MAPPTPDLTLQLVFGRAFLLELERGNLQGATVFARAFLKERQSHDTQTALSAFGPGAFD